MTLHVVAHFHVQSGLGDRVEALLADVVEPTTGEDGCLNTSTIATTTTPTTSFSSSSGATTRASTSTLRDPM